MTSNEQDKPKAADENEQAGPELPSSGEGSASIVARLQIQRELATRPMQKSPVTQGSQGWREE